MEEKEHKKNSKKEVDEDKKSLITVFAIIGILIVVFATTYFVTKYVKEQQAEQKLKESVVKYNNFVFYKDDEGHWLAQLMIRNQAYTIPFYNTPYEVENISLDNRNTIVKVPEFRKIVNGTVYLAVDPDENSKIVVSTVGLARLLGTANNIYNYNVHSALTHDINQTHDYPIITCEDQGIDVIVIRFVVDKENRIYSEGNCITLEAKSADDMVKVSDAFSYRILTIIKS